jgi:cysteine desulfurase
MEAEASASRSCVTTSATKLERALDYVHVNGNMDHHLPGNLNMSFVYVYVEGESLMMGINDVAVSSGSACTSALLQISQAAPMPTMPGTLSFPGAHTALYAHGSRN